MGGMSRMLSFIHDEVAGRHESITFAPVPPAKWAAGTPYLPNATIPACCRRRSVAAPTTSSMYTSLAQLQWLR